VVAQLMKKKREKEQPESTAKTHIWIIAWFFYLLISEFLILQTVFKAFNGWKVCE
jgi:hypothetical protein